MSNASFSIDRLPSLSNIRLDICFLCVLGIALCPNFSPGWHIMKKHCANHLSEMEDKNACTTPKAQKKKSATGMQVLSDIWKHWATFRLCYTWNSASKFKLHEAMTGSQSDDAVKTETILLIPWAEWSPLLVLGFMNLILANSWSSKILLDTFSDRTLVDKLKFFSIVAGGTTFAAWLGTTSSG